MDEKLFSISQLARLRHLTSETLRHYDRIGLLKPTYVDPKTKYRYYSIRQYENLGTVKELRQLGMPLETIVQYFSERNLEKSKKILSEHCDKLYEEMQETARLHQVLKEKLEFIEKLESLPPLNTVEEVDFPERYILTFGEVAGGSKEHALIFTKLEGLLEEVAPILASDRVGVLAPKTLLEKTDEYIPAIPMLFLKEGGDSPYQKTIKKGRYLTMLYRNGHLERYHKSLEIINDYMREHKLKINGEILQFYKLDVTLTNSPQETIIEIQVPIK